MTLDLSIPNYLTFLPFYFTEPTLLLTFSFDWENISNTRDSVKPQFQALHSSLKYFASRRPLGVW